MDQLAETLQVARFNEVVEIQVEEQTIFLKATVDINNGGIQWRQIEPGRELSAHLQTKKWFFPMLNDEARNKYYEQAIEKATDHLLSNLHSKEENKDSPTKIHVLDIGAGSGLLSMMIARKLASAQILSLEMSTSMAIIARRVVEDNIKHFGRDTEIKVVTEHSTNQTLKEKPQLCVSELLESGLLGEGVIPTLRDAWKRLLAPDAIMIPQRAHVFVAAVQGEWIESLHGPRDSSWVSLSVDQFGTRMIDASGVIFPLHALHVVKPRDYLSESKKALSISLQRDDLLAGRAMSNTINVSCIRDGWVHGFLIWWHLELWEGITYSLEPGEEPWQDHWHPCIHPLREAIQVRQGDSLDIKVTHDDNRIFVTVCDVTCPKRQRLDCGERLISPERSLQLSDHERIDFFKNAIDAAIAVKGQNATILDLSDFSLCAAIAGRSCGARRVFSLESCYGELPVTAARVCQMGNKLPLTSETTFEILQCQAEQLTIEVIGGEGVGIVVAEPYYQVLEGWHVQEALNYYCLIRSLFKRGVIAAGFVAVPAVCRIMACAIESEDLRQAYRAAGDSKAASCESICGLDHSSINQHGCNFQGYDMSLCIWQYKHKQLSPNVELARLDYCQPAEGSKQTSASSLFETKGCFDALLIWLEFECSNIEISPLSTVHTKSYRQCVRRLNSSKHVGSTSELKVKTTLLCESVDNSFEIELSVIP